MGANRVMPCRCQPSTMATPVGSAAPSPSRYYLVAALQDRDPDGARLFLVTDLLVERLNLTSNGSTLTAGMEGAGGIELKFAPVAGPVGGSVAGAVGHPFDPTRHNLPYVG